MILSRLDERRVKKGANLKSAPPFGMGAMEWLGQKPRPFHGQHFLA
jgi:hypothetical protein